MIVRSFLQGPGRSEFQDVLLLTENIDNMFIDSLEYTTHLDWTEGLLKAFEETYGYDFTPYLPAVYDEDWIGNFAQIPHPDFSFDVRNEQLANDFASLLTDLYIENHLKPIEEFCLRHGIGLRYQTAYGKTLENARTAMHVTVPETESLYGADLLRGRPSVMVQLQIAAGPAAGGMLPPGKQ